MTRDEFISAVSEQIDGAVNVAKRRAEQIAKSGAIDFTKASGGTVKAAVHAALAYAADRCLPYSAEYRETAINLRKV